MDLPQAELPLAYSAVFPWGNFHMSEKAEEEFGLLPLGPVIEGGQRITPDKDSSERIDVFVVATDELQDTDTPQGFHLPYRSSFYRRGIGIALTPIISREMVMEEINLDAEMLFEDLEESEEGEELPAGLKEQFAQFLDEKRDDIPQFVISHAITGQVGRAVTEISEERLSAEIEKTLLGRIKGGLISIPISTGIFLGTSHLIDGQINGVDLVIGAGLLGLQSITEFSRLKRAVKESGQYYKRLPHLSAHLGRIAANNIHELYCSEHFNARFERTIE